MIKIFTPLLLCLAFISASAKTTFLPAGRDQQVSNPYKNYFDEAYSIYPTIPHGVLEAVAFCNTHFNHIMHQPNEEGSCIGMPKAYGVMGLILDGQHYFSNNLKYIAQLSGFTEEDIFNSSEKEIL